MALSTLKGVYPYNGLDEYMELTPVRVYMSGKKNAGKYALVSAGDLGKVIGYRWSPWGAYAKSQARGGPGMMHSLIMGDRPDGIPDDWVIDHKNRDTFDNRRDNLFWVSTSWNGWNREITGISKYKGVFPAEGSQVGNWTCRFLGSLLGVFEDERDAGWAVARAAIATFPWAETVTLSPATLVRMTFCK